MAKFYIPHTKCETGQTSFFLTVLAIFSYTQLENLAQVYRVNLYIYYLHMCVGHITTEFAGHIIHRSTWHTVFRGERWKMTEMTILVFIAAVQAAVQLRVTNTASMKAQWARAAPALHTHRFCAVHAFTLVV